MLKFVDFVDLHLFVFHHWPIASRVPFCLSIASPSIQQTTISTYFYMTIHYS